MQLLHTLVRSWRIAAMWGNATDRPQYGFHSRNTDELKETGSIVYRLPAFGTVLTRLPEGLFIYLHL